MRALQDAQPQEKKHDYSTIDDPQLLSELASGTPLLVIKEEQAKPAQGERTKPMPVYSVVNKFKTKTGSKENLDNIPSSADEFGFALPGDIQTMDDVLQNLQASVDDLAKYDSIPPPPVPPRTYEMQELEGETAAPSSSSKSGQPNAQNPSKESSTLDATVAEESTTTTTTASETTPSAQLEAAVLTLGMPLSTAIHPYEDIELAITTPAEANNTAIGEML